MSERDEITWRRIKSEAGPELPLFRMRYDWMEHPTTRVRLKRLVLESVDWVNMVARTAAGELVMVEQYRFGISANTVETPGGMVDPGESHLEAAKRELLEESGYGGGEWHYLGAVEPNPAIHDHLCHHWLADGVVRVGDPTPGNGEAIRVLLMGLDEIHVAIEDGRLRHALALSALARVYSLWPEHKGTGNPPP